MGPNTIDWQHNPSPRQGPVLEQLGERGQQASSICPKFTVITVVLNDLKELIRTISSVDQQSGVSYEHLIVDGGSTDGTLEWLNEHSHQHRQLHLFPEQGIYEAMNRAVSQSRGEWLHFLNAGDTYSEKSSLERVSRHCCGDRDLIYTDVYRELAGRVSLWKQKPPFFWGIYRNICHQGIFYRRPILPTPAFETHYRVGADFDNLLRLQMEHPQLTIHYHPEALVHWKTGGFSLKHASEALKERKASLISRINSPTLRCLNMINLFRQKLKLRLLGWDRVR